MGNNANRIKPKQAVKRFPDTGVVLPDDYIAKLNSLSLTNNNEGESVPQLAAHITQLSLLLSTQQQSQSLKQILDRLQGSNDDLKGSLELLIDLLHAGNSRPLHRQLLSGFKALLVDHQPLVLSVIASNMKQRADYILDNLQLSEEEDRQIGLTACMKLVAPLASVLSFPELAPALTGCSTLLTVCMTRYLEAITLPASPYANTNGTTDSHSKAGLSADHIATDTVSNLYMLLTIYCSSNGSCSNASTRDTEEEEQLRLVVVDAARAFISVLKTGVIRTESMSSLGAALYAACALPRADEDILKHSFYYGFLAASVEATTTTKTASSTGSWVLDDFAAESKSLDAFIHELQQVPDDSVIAAIRGLLPCLPPAIKYSCINDSCFITDGVLMHVCASAENAADAMSKLNAIMTLVACLEELKAYWISVDVYINTTTKPFLLQEHCERLSRVLWSSFNDKLTASVKSAGAAFNTFMEILDLQQTVALECGADINKSDDFLTRAAADLAAMPAMVKGRYAPLAAIVSRLGAHRLIELAPDVVQNCLQGMTTQLSLCSAVTVFLEAYWKQLIKETDGGTDACRAEWTRALIPCLCSESDRLRANVTTSLVPVVLELDPGSLSHLLACIAESSSANSKIDTTAGSIALLKTARRLRLISDLSSKELETDIKGILQAAVAHPNDSVRCDVLELACCHPKQTEIPTELELDIIQQAIKLTLRCSNPSTRQKTFASIGKFLVRYKTCADAVAARPREFGPLGVEALNIGCREWLHSVSLLLIGSCYPGANYQRKYTALNILELALKHLRDVDFLHPVLLTPGTVSLLIDCLVDPWDKIRESAATILCSLPTPLPGYAGPEQLEPLLTKARELIASPRLTEADGGARILYVVLHQYSMKLGWLIKPSSISILPAVEKLAAENSNASAVLEFINSVVDIAEESINKVNTNQIDLYEACTASLAHGALLTIRYMVSQLPWALYCKIPSIATKSSSCLTRLLDVCDKLADIVLPILSYPEDNNMGAEDVDDDDDIGDVDDNDGAAPSAQIIMCACWLTMKEIALLLGTLSQVLPMEKDGAVQLLTRQQWQHSGELLLRSLLEMKHNGAVGKAQLGFIALCARLLNENGVAALYSLPGQWLETVLARVTQPGQSLNDIVRRSAGIPFAFVGFMLSQPSDAKKVLTKNAIERLLTVAADGNASEPWPRVHAFNALRAIFLDNKLSLQTCMYWAQGMEESILALAAPEWEVRNAATLCYTALTTRMLGFANMATRDSGTKALGAAEFFARYPRLHAFLLKQLDAIVESLLESNGAEVDPSLTPILAVLTRLRPSSAGPLEASAETGTTSLSPCAFLPALSKCAAAPQHFVRIMASTAFAAFVPVEHRPVVLKALSVCISSTTASNGTPSVSSEPTDTLVAMKMNSGVQKMLTGLQTTTNSAADDWNILHGRLMQLRFLLEAAVVQEQQESINTLQVLDAVAPLLIHCVHLMDPSATNTCAPVSLEMIRSISAISALYSSSISSSSGDGDGTTGRLLAAAALVCRKAALETKETADAIINIDGEMPGISFAMKKATEAYFYWLLPYHYDNGALFNKNTNTLVVDELCCALQSPYYEVRSAALKALAKLLEHTSPTNKYTNSPMKQLLETLPASERRVLYGVLALHAQHETHYKALRRVLHMLHVLDYTAGFGDYSSQNDDDDDLFKVVMHHTQHAKHPEIKQEAIMCIGRLLSTTTTHNSNSHQDGQIDDVLAILQQATDPWELPETRLAAVTAIHTSGLLNYHHSGDTDSTSSSSVSVAIACWDIIICGIDDEDEGIRREAASAAHHALFVHSGSSFDATTSTQKKCTEMLLREIFPALTARYGSHHEFIMLLMKWVCDPDECAMDLAHAQQSATSKRLFNKEPPNNHVELFSRAQLAATSLKHLLIGMSIKEGHPNNTSINSELTSYIAGWVLESVMLLHEYLVGKGVEEQLRELLLSEQQGETVAVPLYRLFLAVWCGGHCAVSIKSVADGECRQIVEQLGAIKEYCIAEGKLVCVLPQLASVAQAAIQEWSDDDGGSSDTDCFPWSPDFLT